MMFGDIPRPILKRMAYLEAADARDRANNTSRMQRLRQVPPETGRFLALMAVQAPVGEWLEIGTSGGYSALWIALACRVANRKLTTFEILADKAALARETLATAGVTEWVDLIEADALERIDACENISFCFLDAEKEVYQAAYDLIVPRMASGGILVADNVISHKEQLQSFVDNAMSDKRVDATVLTIGKGLLYCRRC
ncbi:MAG: O-methyltransferase [bacterium]